MPRAEEPNEPQERTGDDDFFAKLDEIVSKLPKRPKPSVISRIWGVIKELLSVLAPVFAAGWFMSIYSFVLEVYPSLRPPTDAELSALEAPTLNAIQQAQVYVNPAVQFYRETTHPFVEQYIIPLTGLSPTEWLSDYLLVIWFSITAAKRNASYEIQYFKTHRFERLRPLLSEFFSTRKNNNRSSLIIPIFKTIPSALSFPFYLIVFVITFPVRKPIAKALNRVLRSYLSKRTKFREDLIKKTCIQMKSQILNKSDKREILEELRDKLPIDLSDPMSTPVLKPITDAVLFLIAFSSVLIGIVLMLHLLLFLGEKIS